MLQSSRSIGKSICINYQICLSNLQNVFLQIAICICPRLDFPFPLWPVGSAVPRLAGGGMWTPRAEQQQPESSSWRNPPTTPLASRSLHHLSLGPADDGDDMQNVVFLKYGHLYFSNMVNCISQDKKPTLLLLVKPSDDAFGKPVFASSFTVPGWWWS